MKRKTFETLCTELDATLLYARVRIAYLKEGLAPSSLAKRFKIPRGTVKRILKGVDCTGRRPSLPTTLCPESSALWGIPVFRTNCSQHRLKRNGHFYRDAYIPSKAKRRPR